jgi:hypothetical protein
MADHADEAGLLLLGVDRLRVGPAIGHRDLDLHVLAGLHALDRLRGVDLRRRAEDRRVGVGARQRLAQISRHIGNAVFLGYLLGRLQSPTDQRDALHAVNFLDPVQMLLSERACARENDFHFNSLRISYVFSGSRHEWFSRIICPTAVFDAGT